MESMSGVWVQTRLPGLLQLPPSILHPCAGFRPGQCCPRVAIERIAEPLLQGLAIPRGKKPTTPPLHPGRPVRVGTRSAVTWPCGKLHFAREPIHEHKIKAPKLRVRPRRDT